MTMLYEEITKKILAACFEISNELGTGFLESVYQKALIIALQQKGLRAETEVGIPVHFRGERIGMFYADLLVDDKIIVELKAIHAVGPEHKAQVINYLKGCGLEVGLLINFGKAKMEYHRLHNPDLVRG